MSFRLELLLDQVQWQRLPARKEAKSSRQALRRVHSPASLEPLTSMCGSYPNGSSQACACEDVESSGQEESSSGAKS